MMGRYNAILNGKSVLSLSDEMYILDIVENAPNETAYTADVGYSNGIRFLRRRRKSLSVTVHLMLREYSTINRDMLYDRLCEWARPGYLEVDNRPGKRLYVEDISLPSLGSVLKWTGTVSIVLTAYATPYWETCIRQTANISTAAANGSVKLYAPGNADACQVSVRITAGNSTVNAVTITTPVSSMSFAGMALAAGKTLEISRSADGLWVIKKDGTSAMSKRTAASSDELLAVPGQNNTITIEADAPCTAFFATRGRWL